MEFQIKQCKGAVEGWQSPNEFGLFIDGYLISAFLRGDLFELNIDTVLGNGISNLEVVAKINHELSVQSWERTPDNEVYDLYFNGLHVSRYAKGSFVHQNVMRFFKLEPITDN